MKTLHAAAALAARAAARLRRGLHRRASVRAGSLLDVLLTHVRDADQLDVQRADFKLEQLAPHLLMNLRVVDEHGRQLGESGATSPR